jgi:hypothetical protein
VVLLQGGFQARFQKFCGIVGRDENGDFQASKVY